ncbi:hypothetical protein K1719_016740 [Acacia pycnantha]|nr:hypothetical protein K1719_016740 [Acacia pycnantha]
MFVKLIMALVLLSVTTMVQVSIADTSFIFNNGFQSANLTMNGISDITSNGLLQLTNETGFQKSHAFYPNPVVFTNTSSFSTTFVFAIRPQSQTLNGHGFCDFSDKIISRCSHRPVPRPLQHEQQWGPQNHVLAVELDTYRNHEFGDINGNHVGIDINSLNSTKSAPAGYYANRFHFQNLSLNSGVPMQVWVDYDGSKKQISATLGSINVNKPETPLLTLSQDLSEILTNRSYVGFSSSNGERIASHYVLGWSFKFNGEPQKLDTSKLPKLPRLRRNKQSRILPIVLPLLSLCTVALAGLSIVHYINWKKKFSEIVELWEQDYGPHRFKYKYLYIATKGFREKELLGSGGFGSVYKGMMPGSKIEVAVKKVSHGSRQGRREFIAEIMSIGRLRHRNLVPLLGYCRFRIIKGVASGLFYLHQDWEQVVVHRDIKASNILLDSEFNGRLGDFGLARLYNHGSDPTTTHVIGTMERYMAPENTRTRRATTKSDVFSFGAFYAGVPLPDFPTLMSSPSCCGFKCGSHQDLENFGMSVPSSSTDGYHSRTSIAESVLSGGR